MPADILDMGAGSVVHQQSLLHNDMYAAYLDISQLEEGVQFDALSIAISSANIDSVAYCQHTLDHCLQPWTLSYLHPAQGNLEQAWYPLRCQNSWSYTIRLNMQAVSNSL